MKSKIKGKIAILMLFTMVIGIYEKYTGVRSTGERDRDHGNNHGSIQYIQAGHADLSGWIQQEVSGNPGGISELFRL